MTVKECAAADVLDDAAGLVERGWCRGAMADGHGNVCAMGAIERACPIDIPVKVAAIVGLAQVMRAEFPGFPGYFTDLSATDIVIETNDYLANGAEVAACMRKAAVNLRGQL